ncbi:AzlD domain-containing protein [Gracilibacillus caseinilyticus]|uniref:AzlD domain-containing protein n=1 Tax=Gracilibacillus caseinilyticus TaxID=2932256 RepID=A0ABY4EQQ6_9BACI|nr:AzlD domain-containing protein [Gracilibacillus caseinilyticus]UOQ46778.1 AzlD domain-containing protein [Gracilibacillus caseinilyticus]
MIWFIIIGMAVVTVLPRVIPVYIVDFIQFPLWMNKWLKAIPYAALGALIFPGIMTVIPERPYVGVIAGVVAMILAWFRIHVIGVVAIAIITVYLFTI